MYEDLASYTYVRESCHAIGCSVGILYVILWRFGLFSWWREVLTAWLFPWVNTTHLYSVMVPWRRKQAREELKTVLNQLHPRAHAYIYLRLVRYCTYCSTYLGSRLSATMYIGPSAQLSRRKRNMESRVKWRERGIMGFVTGRKTRGSRGRRGKWSGDSTHSTASRVQRDEGRRIIALLSVVRNGDWSCWHFSAVQILLLLSVQENGNHWINSSILWYVGSG